MLFQILLGHFKNPLSSALKHVKNFLETSDFKNSENLNVQMWFEKMKKKVEFIEQVISLIEEIEFLTTKKEEVQQETIDLEIYDEVKEVSEAYNKYIKEHSKDIARESAPEEFREQDGFEKIIQTITNSFGNSEELDLLDEVQKIRNKAKEELLIPGGDELIFNDVLDLIQKVIQIKRTPEKVKIKITVSHASKSDIEFVQKLKLSDLSDVLLIEVK